VRIGSGVIKAAETLQSCSGYGAAGQNDVGLEPEQFRGIFCAPVGVVLGPAGADPHIAPNIPAQFLQALVKAASRSCSSGFSAARFMRAPIRRKRSGCCGRAASGHVAAAPPWFFVSYSGKRAVWYFGHQPTGFWGAKFNLHL
jgi:hypothetical protein